METLKQAQYSPYCLSRQVVELLSVKSGKLDSYPVEKLSGFLSDFYAKLLSSKKEVIERIDSSKDLSKEDSDSILASLDEFLAMKVD